MEIKFSRDIGTSDKFLWEILEMDAIVYNEDLQGTFESVSERYHKNTDSFILVKDRGAIIGYFCFFPITLELYDKMHTKGAFFDDNIRAEQILRYGGENNIFFISTVVRPEYQNGEAIILLTEGFRSVLRQKESENKRICSINAYITSENGVRLARRLKMEKIYDIAESYAFYCANRSAVKEFLS